MYCCYNCKSRTIHLFVMNKLNILVPTSKVYILVEKGEDGEGYRKYCVGSSRKTLVFVSVSVRFYLSVSDSFESIVIASFNNNSFHEYRSLFS
mmetsp:Transcript_44982/g.45575  ORF Transcript_44982/g.45575 Transcript_44982/m.45575 type:complete len:93 (-) Transcript_44982:1457-1735(-)